MELAHRWTSIYIKSIILDHQPSGAYYYAINPLNPNINIYILLTILLVSLMLLVGRIQGFQFKKKDQVELAE